MGLLSRVKAGLQSLKSKCVITEPQIHFEQESPSTPINLEILSEVDPHFKRCLAGHRQWLAQKNKIAFCLSAALGLGQVLAFLGFTYSIGSVSMTFGWVTWITLCVLLCAGLALTAIVFAGYLIVQGCKHFKLKPWSFWSSKGSYYLILGVAFIVFYQLLNQFVQLFNVIHLMTQNSFFNYAWTMFLAMLIFNVIWIHVLMAAFKTYSSQKMGYSQQNQIYMSKVLRSLLRSSDTVSEQYKVLLEHREIGLTVSEALATALPNMALGSTPEEPEKIPKREARRL